MVDYYRTRIGRLVGGGVLAVVMLCTGSWAAAQDSGAATAQESRGGETAKATYFKKILENEIKFLKEQVAKKEGEHKKELAAQQARADALLVEQKKLQEVLTKELTAAKDARSKAEKELKASQLNFEKALQEKISEAKAAQEKAFEEKRVNAEKEWKARQEQFEKTLVEKERGYQAALEKMKTVPNVVAEREQDAGEPRAAKTSAAELSAVQEKLAKAEKDLRAQKDHFETLLQEKERSYTQELNKVRDAIKRDDRSAQDDRESLRAHLVEYEQQVKKLQEENASLRALSEDALQKVETKYKQLDQALREKDKQYQDKLAATDQELAATKKKGDEREQMLRRMLVQKEEELNKKNADEQRALIEEVAGLRKASEQLQAYVIKIKEDLKLKNMLLKEKDTRIAALNEKFSVLSAAGVATEKVNPVIQEELDALERENRQLQAETERLRQELAGQSKEHAAAIDALQNKFVQEQRQLQREMSNSSVTWEDKIRLVEGKYLRQLDDLKKEQDALRSQYERQLKQMADKLREKIRENEQLSRGGAAAEQNKSQQAVRTMLESEAKIAQRQTEGERDSEDKQKARVHLDRAAEAIVRKNYARAKRELESALALDRGSMLANTMLENVNFLLQQQ
ncbi:MAG: hypothetical protein NC924_04525 [Candidatus Omnitrophica bacterium]|nr:hypothetical protein [Candidatus Omnitrophota bacterium]